MRALLDEARDPANLCRMYDGWAAYRSGGANHGLCVSIAAAPLKARVRLPVVKVALIHAMLHDGAELTWADAYICDEPSLANSRVRKLLI